MNHRNEHEGTVMKEENRKSENMESENRKTGNRKTELLGNAPILKVLLAMGLPTIVGMMINALYNLVDAFFVGGLGTSQMGAISAVFPLGQVVVGLGLLFGNGTTSHISRLLEHGDKDTADQVASTVLYSSILVGVLMILLALIFLTPILRLLGAIQSVLPYALTYRGIYVTSSIFNVPNVTINSIVTSEDAAKTTMCAPLSGAVLSMALDSVFIYGLDLGVAGAAIATALPQVTSSLAYLVYILCKKNMFTFCPSQCRCSPQITSEILKIDVPILVLQLLTGLSIILINTQVKEYRDSVIAGMGAITRVILMGSLTIFDFLKGFQPIAGYNYRAKKYDRLRQAIRTSILRSTTFCTVYELVVAVFPTAATSQFTKGDMEMIQVGQKALRANGLSFLPFGYYTAYSSLFLALGRAREGLIPGACRQGICFVPIILALPVLWGINSILYVQPTADIISAIVVVAMSVRLHREPFYIMPSNI